MYIHMLCNVLRFLVASSPSEALTNIRTRGGGNRNVGIKHPLWHIFIQNISCVRGGGGPQQQSQQQQQQQQPPLLNISTQQQRRLWLDSGLAQQQQSLLLLWQFWLVSALHCHAPYFPAHSAEEMIIQYVCDQLSLLIMLVCMLQLKMLTERKIICCWSLLVLKLPIDFSFRLIKWSNILSTACLLCWMSAWHSDDDSQENLTRERDRKGFNNRGTWHCLHETATIWTLVRCWGKANVTFYIYLFKNKDSKSKCDTAFIMTIQFKSELSY